MTTRRAVAWLVAIGILLQVVTAGIGRLYNETDGQYAGAAKIMARGGDWLIPLNNGEPRLVKPPLLYWCMAVSMRVFGENEFAARLPNALGVIAWALATFAIGGRLTDVRTGFLAGVILLTLLGTATLARIVMPEPVFCALIAWAIFCGIRALQSERGGGWPVGVWAFAGLATFTKGAHGLAYPLAILLLAGLWHPAWRTHVPRLISLPGIALALAINLPWYFLVESRFPGWFRGWLGAEQLGHLSGTEAPATHYENVPVWQFVLLHLAWFFPWSITALIDGARCRWSGWSAFARVNAVWTFVILVPLFFLGQRQDYYAMSAWPVFALAAASVICRVGISGLSVAATAICCVGGLAALSILPGGNSASVAERATAWSTIGGFGAEVWEKLGVLGYVTLGLAMLALALALWGKNWRVAAFTVVSAIFSIGAVVGYATVAPYFSLAEAAPVLNAPSDREAPIVFDGGLDTASSLLFYTDRPLILLDGNTTAPVRFAELWRSGRRLAFVTERTRMADWESRLGPFSEPIATCGTLVVIESGQ